MHPKSHYLKLRAKYQPPKIKLILIAESPPASGNYFYDPTGRTTEPLFFATMKVIGENPATKEEGLTAFARKGFFLVDATYQPVNHLRNQRQRNEAILKALPKLIQDLKDIIGNQSVKIVLVKANICRLLEEPLKSTDFNVINNGTIVPFPSHGNQTKFHQAIQCLLKTEKHMKKKWETYEEVAAYLLNQFAEEFGLSRVEGKQVVKGRKSGTEWEIDAKGVREGNAGFIIVECRRYTTSKQSQEKVGSLAYKITDTGAKGGIVVSPLGFQEGARKIAAAENIVEVRLAPDSTPNDFNMQFLNKMMIGVSGTMNLSGEVQMQVGRTCSVCRKTFTVKENESVCPECSPRVLILGPESE